MSNARRLRTMLLAAASLSAASAVAVTAHAAAPTVSIETSAPVAHAVDEMQAQNSPLRNVGIAALLTGAAAAFYRLVCGARLSRWLGAIGPVAEKAARTAFAAPVAAAKAVGRAAASPFRFALLMTGLGLFALTGLGLYDVEWLGGLVAGAALVAATWVFVGGARRALARRTTPARKQPDQRL